MIMMAPAKAIHPVQPVGSGSPYDRATESDSVPEEYDVMILPLSERSRRHYAGARVAPSAHHADRVNNPGHRMPGLSPVTQPVHAICVMRAVPVVSLTGYSTTRDSAHPGGAMAKTDGVFIYIGTYPSEAVARGDYEVVKDLHALDAVGSYDAAVITKDDSGKVNVNKDETSTRHGAWAVSYTHLRAHET